MKKELFAEMRRIGRCYDRLKELGLSIKYERRLMRMSKVVFRCGRLHDGICHYRNAMEVSGNTYSVKDLLKGEGFRWDAKNKLWWGKLPSGAEFPGKLVRRLKGRG